MDSIKSFINSSLINIFLDFIIRLVMRHHYYLPQYYLNSLILSIMVAVNIQLQAKVISPVDRSLLSNSLILFLILLPVALRDGLKLWPPFTLTLEWSIFNASMKRSIQQQRLHSFQINHI